jgi:hypothetical protein
MNTLTHNSTSTMRRRGLSLVEALIALAITAMLLTAIAAAFTSTAEAMQINDQFFRASQASRVSVARVMSQARRGLVSEKDAYSLVPLADNQTISYIRMLTPSVNQPDPTKTVYDELIYKYDSTAKELQMYPVVNNVIGTKHVLAHDVTAASFTVGLGQDANKATCVSRLSMAITVTEGSNIVRLSGAAVPRVTLSY